MTNREKVIKGIEICLEFGCQGEKCPYFPADDCVLNIMRDTLALLKEQEPLTILSGRFEEIYNYIAECPECGMEWAMWRPDKMRYCPGCGKAVKWKCL